MPVETNPLNTYAVRDLLKAFKTKFLEIKDIKEINPSTVRSLVEDSNFSSLGGHASEQIRSNRVSMESAVAALRSEFSNQIASSKYQAVNNLHGNKHYDLTHPILRLELHGIENVKLENPIEGIAISEIPGFLDITIDPTKFNDTKKLLMSGEFKGERVEFTISPKGSIQPLRGTFDQANTAKIPLPSNIDVADKEIPFLEKESSDIALKVSKEDNGKTLIFKSNRRTEQSIETNQCKLSVNGREMISRFVLEPAPPGGSSGNPTSSGLLDAFLKLIRVR